MGEILPDTDNIDLERQTSDSVSNMAEGQGNSDTEEQRANFICEEQTSQWFNEFETARNRHKVREVTNDVLVKKLPASFRVPLEQYTPRLWQIGLHNRDVLHPSESEDLKIALATASELEPWDQFCASVVDDPVGVLRAYGLDHSEAKFSRKQVQYLLTLDALTIFLVFAVYTYNHAIIEKRFQIGARVTALVKTRLECVRLYSDLFLVENQIPIALLRKVISTYYAKPRAPFVDEESMFEIILLENVSMMCGYIFVPKDSWVDIREAYPQGEWGKCPHILAFVYRILCGQNFRRRSGATTITIRSATELKKAGIQFKGIEGVLDKVDFRKRCLFLPIVRLGDDTESCFRNLAMYEYMEDYNSFKCPFGEYLQLMTSLIKEVGDLEYLIDCGVIQNGLFSDNDAFQIWNNFQSNLLLPGYSKEYVHMVSTINKEYLDSVLCVSLYEMRTEFCQLYCSKPWYMIGLLSATIVTVGTCIVAYTSVIASDKMQPHFPP